jgi:ATP-dependent protease ClpP protease subunit
MSDEMDVVDDDALVGLPEIIALEADADGGVIYLFEEVSSTLLRRIVPTLYWMASEHERIKIVATSPGGSDACMFALADVIQSLDVPVDLDAFGHLSSAATILLAVCDVRRVGPLTEVCLHSFRVSGVDDSNSVELVRAVASVERAAERWAGLLAVRTEAAYSRAALHLIATGASDERRLIGLDIVAFGLADSLVPLPLAHQLTGSTPPTSPVALPPSELEPPADVQP